LVSCYLIFLLRSLCPVFQKVHREGVAEGGVQALTELNTSIYAKAVAFIASRVVEALPEDQVVLEAVEPALGRGVVPGVPLAVIEQAMPYCASVARTA
jgi:hypothetical protein